MYVCVCVSGRDPCPEYWSDIREGTLLQAIDSCVGDSVQLQMSDDIVCRPLITKPYYFNENFCNNVAYVLIMFSWITTFLTHIANA